jgi:rhodanese-related sulfurtransferase
LITTRFVAVSCQSFVSLRQRISAKLSTDAQLIDVREPCWGICRLRVRSVPLAQLQAQISALDRDREIIVYCHKGVRSVDAALRRFAQPGSRVSLTSKAASIDGALSGQT